VGITVGGALVVLLIVGIIGGIIYFKIFKRAGYAAIQAE